MMIKLFFTIDITRVTPFYSRQFKFTKLHANLRKVKFGSAQEDIHKADLPSPQDGPIVQCLYSDEPSSLSRHSQL